jgi:hypothetical protein
MVLPCARRAAYIAEFTVQLMPVNKNNTSIYGNHSVTVSSHQLSRTATIYRDSPHDKRSRSNVNQSTSDGGDYFCEMIGQTRSCATMSYSYMSDLKPAVPRVYKVQGHDITLFSTPHFAYIHLMVFTGTDSETLKLHIVHGPGCKFNRAEQ